MTFADRLWFLALFEDIGSALGNESDLKSLKLKNNGIEDVWSLNVSSYD